MSDEQVDIEAQVRKYTEDFLKRRGDYDNTAPTLLNIKGLNRVKLNDIFFPIEEARLAFYARGFQLYRLADTKYGLMCVILVEHYEQNEFYDTKQYDESIHEKLEAKWVKLETPVTGEAAGKLVISSAGHDFNEILDNVDKDITANLLYYIDLFTKNKES